MSSIVRVTNVDIDNPEAAFTEGYSINIAFEVMEPLSKDIIWKVIYIGHPDKEEYDQVLEDIEMPVTSTASFKFNVTTEAPNIAMIPKSEMLGVTALLVSCEYDNKEFFRVGYYVNSYYTDPELNEEPPANPIIEKLQRSVLKDQPRVTNFQIEWDTGKVNTNEEFKATEGFGFEQPTNMKEGFGDTGFAKPPSIGFGHNLPDSNTVDATNQSIEEAQRKEREAMMSVANIAKIADQFKDSKT